MNYTYNTVNEEDNFKTERITKIGIRHLQVFLLFLCYATMIGTRFNMSISIVAMTTINNQSSVEIFDWNKKTQGIILSSFFWGYLAMQIPAGFIVNKFGGKTPILVSMTLNGLISLLTPIATHLGDYKATSAIRAVQGLSQGVFIPSLQALLGVWVPPQERGRLASFVFGGIHFGLMTFFTLGGVLGGSSLGWPSIFYVQGIISLVLAVVWCYFGSNSPAIHTTIKESERLYIQKSLNQTKIKKSSSVPWNHILRSPEVWALCIANIGCAYTTFSIMNEVPVYMTKIMGTDVRTSGILTALPDITKWIATFLLSLASDAIVNRALLSRTNCRKLFNTLGTWPLCLALIAFPYIRDIIWAEVLLIFGMSLIAGQSLGYFLGSLDLAPNYAGVLSSMTNFCGKIAAVTTPFVSGFIMTDLTDISLWRIQLCVTAAVCFFTNLLYLILGSADVQKWNDFEDDTKTSTDTNTDLRDTTHTKEDLLSSEENKICLDDEHRNDR